MRFFQGLQHPAIHLETQRLAPGCSSPNASLPFCLEFSPHFFCLERGRPISACSCALESPQQLKVQSSVEICAKTDLRQDPAWEKKPFRCLAEGRSAPIPIEPGVSPCQGPLTCRRTSICSSWQGGLSFPRGLKGKCCDVCC